MLFVITMMGVLSLTLYTNNSELPLPEPECPVEDRDVCGEDLAPLPSDLNIDLKIYRAPGGPMINLRGGG